MTMILPDVLPPKRYWRCFPMTETALKAARNVINTKLNDTAYIRVSIVSDLLAIIERQQEALKLLRRKVKR